MLVEQNDIGVPQSPQKVRSTPGEEWKTLAVPADHFHWPSLLPMNVVIGAEHCLRQLSQWQITQATIGGSISNLIVPHRHLPPIFSAIKFNPSICDATKGVAII
jgi:hypothetical protein